MKITVVVPIWRRQALTKLCVDYWTGWNVEWADLDFVIVASPGDEVPEFAGDVDVIERPNSPLGAKFNAGIRRAYEREASYVMIMGSDVLVKDSLFEEYRAAIDVGAQFVGVYDTYLYDVDLASAFYWPGYTNHRRGEVIGPGRLYARSLLRKWECRIYPEKLDRNLDGGADRTLPPPVGLWARDHKMLSVKTPGQQITATENYPGLLFVPTAELHYPGVNFLQLCT